jgi:hypothetical protein
MLMAGVITIHVMGMDIMHFSHIDGVLAGFRGVVLLLAWQPQLP